MSKERLDMNFKLLLFKSQNIYLWRVTFGAWVWVIVSLVE